jgi:hypothetical protein
MDDEDEEQELDENGDPIIREDEQKQAEEEKPKPKNKSKYLHHPFTEADY